MQGKGHEMPEKRNTYLTLHKNFVRTDIECTDRVTGEVRTFNSVTLPKGTVIDGVDVSYYQFSPMFVNESRYRGENYRDIPLLTDREVWLKKSVLDENGQPVLKKGKPQPDTTLRDTENVPLKEDIQTYFAREVLPFAPDAWIDEKKSKVGYEIPFTRYFYKYEAPKPSAEIMQEILAIEAELDGALAEVFGE